jgi:hypothetical protein
MALRELAEREADGIVVELFWADRAQRGADVIVSYEDRGERAPAFTSCDRP